MKMFCEMVVILYLVGRFGVALMSYSVEDKDVTVKQIFNLILTAGVLMAAVNIL